MRAIAALKSLMASRWEENHGQYGRAPDDSQSQAPGDLDARQPPVLPQHREDG